MERSGTPRRRIPAIVVAAAAAVLLALPTAAALGAGPAATTLDLTESCAVQGAVTQSGGAVISQPMADAVGGSPLALTIPAEVQVTHQTNPGGLVTTIATLRLDLAGLASDILEHRVKPAVAAAGYPALVPTAWVELDLPRTTATFALPPGTTPTGPTTVAGGAAGAATQWTADGLVLTLGALHTDTRLPSAPVVVTAGWRVTDGGAPAPRTVTTVAPAVAFAARVQVGLKFYGSPVTGAVSADWGCAPDPAGQALATTDVVAEPVPVTSPPALPTPGPPPGTGTTQPPPSTWPAATTTPPGTCMPRPLDAYGGDAGLQLDATGYFRVERLADGRFWYVDPAGHPFWSSGVNHVSWEGTADRNGLAAYHDAVVARYGTALAWGAAERARMDDWGYNTLGAWSDVEQFGGNTPYTLLLSITASNFSTGEMEDLWTQHWVDDVHDTVSAAAAAHRDDPFLLGYWFDNELHWGPDWRPLHLFDEYLGWDAASPGHQALVAWLRDRYDTFDEFAADFTTTATGWDDLTGSAAVTAWTDGGQATRNAWTGVVAERYYSVTDEQLTAADPNHLNLGARMIAQTTGVPVLEAAARHVDVVSLNTYAIDPALVASLEGADPTYLPTDDALAAQAAVVQAPIMVTEWSFRSADAGLPNTWPPLFPTLKNQAQRAAAYERFVRGLLDSTWIVGQHWFEFTDEPAAGRFDGEDSNFGLVDRHDDPYPEVTGISRTMHDCAYARVAAIPAEPEPEPPPPGPPPTGSASSTTTSTTAASATTTTTGTATTAPGGGTEPPPPPTTGGPSATAAEPVSATAEFTG